MAKRTPKGNASSNTAASPQTQLETELKSLLKQKKYRQALDEIHKVQRSQPDLEITPSEAEIWLLRGQQEFQKRDYKQADSSFRRALQLGLAGEVHYWLAKTLLARDQLDGAISLIQSAFEDGSLPKDYSICYAKLLLLKGDTATVEHLLNKQSKRLPAAHQHWLRGVLALKAEQSEAALEFFQKVKRPVTAGDRPDIWQIYTQQALQQWEVAALKLGLGIQTTNMWGFPLGKPTYAGHPILQRLALLQHMETGQPPLEQMQFSLDNQVSSDLVDILSILEFIAENNPHEAAHTLLKLDRHSSKFPELAAIRPALLALAGQQSVAEGEMSCAVGFWQQLQKEQPFDPQLAVNLMKALGLNQDYQELQRLITRIIKWLEQDFKQNPQNWSEERRKAALVYAHCRLADTWMVMGRERTAMGELKTAERIDPKSPEIKGRHGLIAVLEERYEEATQLLTEALEEGCRYPEVYTVLIKTWRNLGNSEAVQEVRRRFGKKFGDLTPELDVEVLPWVDALSTKDYSLFSHLVQGGSDRDPAMRACQIFDDAVQGEPTGSGKVSLDQTQAVQEWDQLLKQLSTKEQVPTLQAIALSLLLFAKREKGIAALITQYMVKLFELGTQQPEAKEAHLVILALKERDSKKLQIPFQTYLNTMPQPGNALAQIQLQIRRYTQNILQDQILRSFIDDSLKREPQNPLLLLAKATTFPPSSPKYEEFKQQGFEIARRLQDAKALQAFRNEEAFLNAQTVQEFLPTPDAFGNFSLSDMDDLLENMIRKMFGNQIPPSELKRMMPELKQMMMNSMPPDFGDDDDDFEFDFGSPFGFMPPPSPPPRRKRR